MDAHPDHPASEQAFTTFRVPSRLPQLALVLVLAIVVLHTVWDAITATGAFTEAPGPMRAAVVAGISYLSIRYSRARLHHWRGRHRGFGPAIERIDPDDHDRVQHARTTARSNCPACQRNCLDRPSLPLAERHQSSLSVARQQPAGGSAEKAGADYGDGPTDRNSRSYDKAADYEAGKNA